MRLRVQQDERFKEAIRIEGGPEVTGSIQRASDAETPALDFSNPRLMLRVGLHSLVNTGDVIRRVGSDERFVVADHSRTPWYRTYWLFTAHRQVLWQAPVSSVEPLTGLPQDNSWSAGEDIWVGWEIVTREQLDRQLNTREELYRVVTGREVALNDQIAGHRVKRINEALGIYFLTVQ